MTLTLSARRRLPQHRQRWATRVPLARLLLRQEYAIALQHVQQLSDLRQQHWSVLLTRDMVTDAVAEYIADPFLLRAGPTHHLFFEVLNLRTGRGELSVAHSSDLTRWTYGGVVLREAQHLSYPYVFEHAGQHYMVPETAERGTISLYRASRFPYGWERVRDLATGAPYVDSSLFHDQGWWLVTHILGRGGPHVFRADHLDGEWVPVPVEGPADDPLTRSGGRIFRAEGRWYRPVQRFGRFYGEDLWLKRLEITPQGTYREVLAPDVPQPLLAPHGSGWNSLGMHHLEVLPCAEGQLVAVDGKALILELSPYRIGLRLRNRLFGRGRP